MAQQQSKKKLTDGLSVNVNFGSSLFWGDMRVYDIWPVTNFHNEWGWSYGVILKKDFNPYISIRGQLLNGNLSGTRRTANRYFEAKNFEYGAQGVLNLTNLFFRDNLDKKIDLYGLIGIGFANWKTEVKDLNSDEVVGGNGSTKAGLFSRTTETVIPVGAGFNIKLDEKLDLTLEGSMRIVNSDLLDDWEGGVSHDMYSYASIGVTYNFNNIKPVIYKPIDEYIIAEREVIPVAEPEPLVDILYDIPVRTQCNNEFDMKLTIKKGNLSGQAEITQILPVGFTASEPNWENGSFAFEGQTVKIFWDELPELPSFTISYKVTNGQMKSGTYPIIGELMDASTKSYQFNNNIYIAECEDVVRRIGTKTVEREPERFIKEIPSGGVEYRVQIRASFGKKLSEDYLKNRFKIIDDIQENYIDGFYKYSVGSFDNKRDASAYKSVMRSQHGVDGAFVVTYKDGKRLSLYSELAGGKPGSEVDAPLYTESGVVFKVQIKALLNRNSGSLNKIKNLYNLTKEIKEEHYGKWYRYTVGDFSSFQEAKNYKRELVNVGITDSFVVAYKSGVRIKI